MNIMICKDCYEDQNDDPEFDDKKACPVCFKEYQKGNRVELVGCSHRFCKSCIETWKKKNNSCPICRQKNIVLKKKPYFTWYSFEPETHITSSRPF